MSEQISPALTSEERRILLTLARQAIDAAARHRPLPSVALDELPAALREPKACFVTLHKHGQLRGCTGVLSARAPLALEVVRTASQTAMADPRFWPVTPDEVAELEIEISVLTPPSRLDYSTSASLPGLLRPGIDGVTLIRGPHRATFLPQVWEKVPDATTFLDMLCEKMGLPRRSWLYAHLDVETYQVEEFSEATVGPV